MIRNEICCDICGCTVALIDGGLFRRVNPVYGYISVPYRYQGTGFKNGGVVAIPSKSEKHICNNCMKKFVYKAIDEKKEQSK